MNERIKKRLTELFNLEDNLKLVKQILHLEYEIQRLEEQMKYPTMDDTIKKDIVKAIAKNPKGKLTVFVTSGMQLICDSATEHEDHYQLKNARMAYKEEYQP